MVRDRVLTLPNALSVLRLVGVPVFVWAIVVRHDVLAIVILALSGLTDYLDGKIARRFDLVSRVGELLDPIADRLYIASTLVGLAWRGIVPWWLVAVLFAREVFMLGVVVVAKRYGFVGLPVHYIGKAATMNLLYAFPHPPARRRGERGPRRRAADRLGVRVVGDGVVLGGRAALRRPAPRHRELPRQVA